MMSPSELRVSTMASPNGQQWKAAAEAPKNRASRTRTVMGPRVDNEWVLSLYSYRAVKLERTPGARESVVVAGCFGLMDSCDSRPIARS